MEVDSQDVVRVVLQFLKENKLQDSLQALEKETGVTLAVVSSVAELRSAIEDGRWAQVLGLLGQHRLTLQDNDAWTMYEFIVNDLVGIGQQSAAQELLEKSVEIAALKMADGERFDNLQDVAYHDFSSARRRADAERLDKDGYTAKRKELARKICQELKEVGPSRLLGLIGDALTWRRQHGKSTHLLRPCDETSDTAKQIASTKSPTPPGPSKKRKRDEPRPTIQVELVSKIGVVDNAMCAAFAPGGNTLAVGSRTGFIEIFDWNTGQLRTDLKYQANGDVMSHKDMVLGLAFSADSKILASGCKGGHIRVWSVRSGVCKLRIKKAHLGKHVTCLCVSQSTKNILSGGMDNRVRLFGYKTGTMMLEFAGHESQINQVLFFADTQKVASASSDHTCKLWNASTAALLASVDLGAPVWSVVYTKISSDGIGNVLVACGGKENVALIDAETHTVNVANTLEGEKDKVLSALVAPRTTKRLLAIDDHGSVYSVEPQPHQNLVYKKTKFKTGMMYTFTHPREPVAALCNDAFVHVVRF